MGSDRKSRSHPPSRRWYREEIGSHGSTTKRKHLEGIRQTKSEVAAYNCTGLTFYLELEIRKITFKVKRRSKNKVRNPSESLNTVERKYEIALREYQSASGKTETKVKIGDIAQIHYDTIRIHWKFGIVENLITGRDGLVIELPTDQ